jgi:hypothetical protein
MEDFDRSEIDNFVRGNKTKNWILLMSRWSLYIGHFNGEKMIILAVCIHDGRAAPLNISVKVSQLTDPEISRTISIETMSNQPFPPELFRCLGNRESLCMNKAIKLISLKIGEEKR